ncbi:MAG: hypothetical protein IJI47_05515, partial [Eubacterium sp.]|nr:hypothetical protein [Eubacterium sp.]
KMIKIGLPSAGENLTYNLYQTTLLSFVNGMGNDSVNARDTQVVNGRNPIVAHQYLGESVEGKDLIIVDDMISSGESMLEVARKLKELKANRIFVCCSFGLFCNGLEVFDKAHEDGIFEKLYTTNGIYQPPELLARDWYESVELSKYLAYFLDTINHDLSVSSLLNSSSKIHQLLINKGLKK